MRVFSIICMICFFISVALGVVEEYSFGLLNPVFVKLNDVGLTYELRLLLSLVFLALYLTFWLLSERQ